MKRARVVLRQPAIAEQSRSLGSELINFSGLTI
jgi:hypothetical protein